MKCLGIGMDCEACGDGSDSAYGSCIDCSISVCYDHDCLMGCSNCGSYVCMACAKSHQSGVGHCCDSCSTMTICDCGTWEDYMSECGDGCGPKCDDCLTSCSSCSTSFCCKEFTEFQGNTVCTDCAEGLKDALDDHFAAGNY